MARTRAAFFAAALFCLSVGSQAGTNAKGLKYLAENAKKPGVIVTASGLQYRVLKSGPADGPIPTVTSPCEVHYRGTLIDGTEFDSSYARGQPLTFAPNQVVKGWTEAMQLMREGDKWELTLPSELAYGDRGAGGKIGPGSVLVFEMEILKVREPSGGFWSLLNSTTLQGLLALAVVVACAGAYLYSSGSSARGPVIELADAMDPSNPRVFMEITIGGEEAGRIELELFAKVYPKTAENFRCLCTGEKGHGSSGKALHFKNSSFHRIIPGFMCQGGDFTRGNGTGGESIYGMTFADEFQNGVVKHSKPFLLSMANAGPNTNGSQFFLTVASTPHLDGRHVVFGQVVAGEAVVKAMEKVGSREGDTKKNVVVNDCGEVLKKDE